MLRFPRSTCALLASRAASCAAPLALLAALAWPGEARANGRFPAANQLVASPTDPTFLSLRTTFGVLFSHDSGGTWDWICEKGVGYGGVEDPSLGILSTGVIAGTFEGLAASPDQGCSWSMTLPGPITDVVVRRDDPSVALLLASKYSTQGDAGESLFDSRIYTSSDAGAHWTQVGDPIDPEVLPETLEVTADGKTTYVSGIKTDTNGVTAGAFLASINGAPFVEYTIPLAAQTERAPFISAVDPKNGQRVYVRVKGTNGSRLIVTDDGGKTFRDLFTAQGDLLGFALSADGSKVYAGGPADGLMVASSADLKFTKRSGIQVQCLTVVGSTLFACSNEASGFVVGTSSDDGVTFTPKLHLGCMRGPLACPATASSTQCVADFPALQSQLGAGASCGTDGGVIPTGDGGAPVVDAGASPSGGSVSGSGCAASPVSSGATSLGALGALGAIALLVARARRR